MESVYVWWYMTWYDDTIKEKYVCWECVLETEWTATFFFHIWTHLMAHITTIYLYYHHYYVYTYIYVSYVHYVDPSKVFNEMSPQHSSLFSLFTNFIFSPFFFFSLFYFFSPADKRHSSILHEEPSSWQPFRFGIYNDRIIRSCIDCRKGFRFRYIHANQFYQRIILSYDLSSVDSV